MLQVLLSGNLGHFAWQSCALAGVVWDASFILRLVCTTNENVHSKWRVLDKE